jgi:multicomponent Na+:H+ antiporter subunit G
MSAFELAALVLVSVGAFFLMVGSVGVVRLPDFYARTHATGKSDTLGLMLTIAGLAIHEGFSLNTAKLVAVVVFVALTNPVGTHALARAAHRSGLQPWFRGDPVPDALISGPEGAAVVRAPHEAEEG